MIDLAIGFLLGELNRSLGSLFPLPEPRVVAAGLFDADVKSVEAIDNRIVLSLVRIERETAAQTPANGSAAAIPAALNLNLYVLLSSNFTGYELSLSLLSAAIGFLHSKPVFTAHNSAAFPAGLDRLNLEIVNLSVQDQQNLWAMMGRSYLPSVFYKVRMVSLADVWLRQKEPVITGTHSRQE
ncbi:MAG TPA: DUF4255 domain-containing protein [Bryobacteraceae bacterium]|nr:DUF4255 domain-containing protein [Bryobacteraceae bacterium]